MFLVWFCIFISFSLGNERIYIPSLLELCSMSIWSCHGHFRLVDEDHCCGTENEWACTGTLLLTWWRISCRANVLVNAWHASIFVMILRVILVLPLLYHMFWPLPPRWFCFGILKCWHLLIISWNSSWWSLSRNHNFSSVQIFNSVRVVYNNFIPWFRVSCFRFPHLEYSFSESFSGQIYINYWLGITPAALSTGSGASEGWWIHSVDILAISGSHCLTYPPSGSNWTPLICHQN